MISGGFPTLGAKNLSRAVRFYVETMGMKLSAEGVLSAKIDAGDGLIFQLVKDGPALTVPLCFFVRGDIKETVEIYENRGIVFTQDEATDGKHYRFVDPEGNHLALTK